MSKKNYLFRLLLIVVLIVGIIIFLFFIIGIRSAGISITPGSKECSIDSDCVVHGRDGSCYCGCYNKNRQPIHIGSGMCFCAAPPKCKCENDQCVEDLSDFGIGKDYFEISECESIKTNQDKVNRQSVGRFN